MSVKDMPVQMKKATEALTPHRLTVAILIREFCIIRETIDLYRKCIRDFCILALQLIQSPDLSLEELRNLLLSEKYALIDDSLIKNFIVTVCTISNVGVRFLLEIVDSIGRLMTIDNVIDKTGIVNKNSVIGYFLRRLVVTFDMLSFSEITVFFDGYKRYTASLNPVVDNSRLSGPSSAAKNENRSNSDTGREWSKRQAELFIATQTALLTNNEEKAPNPKELHLHIRNLLKSNPDLSEAHFLNFLNYLRVKEFCGAIDSLHHCFDKSTMVDPKGTAEDDTKSYRYAALNLAILHFYFGQKNEALASLKEAITIAQEANDNVCLQYVLSWLYCLTGTNRHMLMEHSILKCVELNLFYLMSLGIQSFIQYAGTMGNPKHVFGTLTKSDIINSQQNLMDLISSSYSQKSAIWLFYGKTEMSSLWSQLLLFLNTDNPSVHKSFYGEAYCQALCNIAFRLHEDGEYNLSYSVVNLAKERFQHEPISHIWMLCENVMDFQQSLLAEKLLDAESAATKIAVIDQWESYLRMAELLIHKCDFVEAHNCVNRILEKCKDGSKKFRMDIQVRAMLLLADIQVITCFEQSAMSGILGLLNSSLAYANDYNLNYLAALAQLHIAHVQLLLGMPFQALNMMNRCTIQILAHGSCYDQARTMLLYSKCIIAQANNKSNDERRKELKEAVEMLEKVRKQFENIEAFYRVKDVLLLEAKLYNELKMYDARNQCAMEYRMLDEDYPTMNCYTLITTL